MNQRLSKDLRAFSNAHFGDGRESIAITGYRGVVDDVKRLGAEAQLVEPHIQRREM